MKNSPSYFQNADMEGTSRSPSRTSQRDVPTKNQDSSIGNNGVKRLAVWQGYFDIFVPFTYFCNVRTTVQLDDKLLAEATKLAREKGYDLSRLIEEILRDKVASTSPAAPCHILQLTTIGGAGIRPGVDLDNSAELLALMDQGK